MHTVCGYCKIEFYTRSRKRKYCSHGCYAKIRTGVKRPLQSEQQRGNGNGNWKGGRLVDKDGYILIHAPYHPFGNQDGYVREHRLVMEKSLKRFLQPDEVVNHINEVKSDNRLENLQLMTKQAHDRLSIAHRHQRGWKPWEKLKLAEGQWSRTYSVCSACGTTTSKHRGKGLCNRCYQQKAAASRSRR